MGDTNLCQGAVQIPCPEIQKPYQTRKARGLIIFLPDVTLQQVPVIRLGHLSDAQRKALVIADNQLALNALVRAFRLR